MFFLNRIQNRLQKVRKGWIVPRAGNIQPSQPSCYTCRTDLSGSFRLIWSGISVTGIAVRSQLADGGKYSPHHRAGDRHLHQLEGECSGMTNAAGNNLDQLELAAAQSPVGHRLGLLDAAREGSQVLRHQLHLPHHSQFEDRVWAATGLSQRLARASASVNTASWPDRSLAPSHGSSVA